MRGYAMAIRLKIGKAIIGYDDDGRDALTFGATTDIASGTDFDPVPAGTSHVYQETATSATSGISADGLIVQPGVSSPGHWGASNTWLGHDLPAIARTDAGFEVSALPADG